MQGSSEERTESESQDSDGVNIWTFGASLRRWSSWTFEHLVCHLEDDQFEHLTVWAFEFEHLICNSKDDQVEHLTVWTFCASLRKLSSWTFDASLRTWPSRSFELKEFFLRLRATNTFTIKLTLTSCSTFPWFCSIWENCQRENVVLIEYFLQTLNVGFIRSKKLKKLNLSAYSIYSTQLTIQSDQMKNRYDCIHLEIFEAIFEWNVSPRYIRSPV